MQPHKFALQSRNVVVDPRLFPDLPNPLHAIVLVSDGLIEDIVPAENVTPTQCDLERICREYLFEDLGDLCLSPGLVDLCVELNGDSYAHVTKAAVMGGVTTVATHQTAQGLKYADIAQLAVLSDDSVGAAATWGESDIFGLRAYLVSQDSTSGCLTRIAEGLAEAAAAGLPVLLHPELTTEKSLLVTSPFRALDTAQRQEQKLQKVPEVTAFADESEEEEEEDVADEVTKQMRAPKTMYQHSPTSKDQGVLRRTSLKVPTFVKPFDPAADGGDSPKATERKRVSLPSIFTGLSLGGKSKKFAALSKAELSRFKKAGVKESIKRGSWMSSSSESIEEEAEKPLGDGAEDGSEYAQHLAAHPQSLEVDAVEMIVNLAAAEPGARVHVTAVGSAEAVKVVSRADPSIRCRVTFSTAISFLHFTADSIKPGDTRYKCTPPIRDEINQSQLWAALQTKEIGCITAFHQPHSPGAKFLGSFKKAKNGVTAIGLSLAVVWSVLQSQSRSFHQSLLHVAEWLSLRPAEVLNIHKTKGSIAPGKHADFVVWDPNAVRKVEALPYQYPDMCPFKGEELKGVVYRTYLRGNLVFSGENCVAAGEKITRKEVS